MRSVDVGACLRQAGEIRIADEFRTNFVGTMIMHASCTVWEIGRNFISLVARGSW